MNTMDLVFLLLSFLLGITVGVIALYYSLKDRLQRNQQIMLERRFDQLEQVARHVGKVSHVFSRYVSLASEIGPRTDRMTSGQEKELEDLSNQLVEVYEEVSIAESKLLLLGEQKLEKALKLYTATMAKFRKQIYPGRYQNTEELSQLKKEVAHMREQFYDVLSQRYDSKLSH